MNINDRIKRVKPFLSFTGIGVGELVDGTVKKHGVSLAELPIGKSSVAEFGVPGTSHGNAGLVVRICTADESPNRSVNN
jgi:hypothetical protein